MLSAPRYASIRLIGRFAAAFLLAGAVAGTVLIPRFLGPGGETPVRLGPPPAAATTVVHAAAVPPLLRSAPDRGGLANLGAAGRLVATPFAAPAPPALAPSLGPLAPSLGPSVGPSRRTAPGSATVGPPRPLRPVRLTGPKPTIAPEPPAQNPAQNPAQSPTPTPVPTPSPAPAAPAAPAPVAAPAAPATAANRKPPVEKRSPPPVQPPSEPPSRPHVPVWIPGRHPGPLPIPIPIDGNDSLQNLRTVLGSNSGLHEQPAQLQQQGSQAATQSSVTSQSSSPTPTQPTSQSTTTTTTSQSDSGSSSQPAPAPSGSTMQPLQTSVAVALTAGDGS